jgi:hypothetical protein
MGALQKQNLLDLQEIETGFLIFLFSNLVAIWNEISLLSVQCYSSRKIR